MNSTPPDFNPDAEPNGFKVEPGSLEDPTPPDEPPVNLSPLEQERLQDAQHKLRRLFLALVTAGALLGLFVAIALILVLNRFGLVGTPEEPEQYQQILQQVFLCRIC